MKKGPKTNLDDFSRALWHLQRTCHSDEQTDNESLSCSSLRQQSDYPLPPRGSSSDREICASPPPTDESGLAHHISQWQVCD